MSSKDAAAATRALHAAALAALPREDGQDFSDARRGLIEETPDLRICTEDGRPVWDAERYAFLREEAAPDTVHPSLWRQERLNAVAGLFEVCAGVWQVRGYDVSNLTIIRGERGVVLVDALMSIETAQAAMRLVRRRLGDLPVTGILLTHAHADHFGGLAGILSCCETVPPLIAPEGYLEAVAGESVLPGPAMRRRSAYQFAPRLACGPRGNVGCGLGKTVSTGTSRLIEPTDYICKTGESRVIDGVEFVFQMTPDAESPAEFCFYLPRFRALCMSEILSRTQHNVLPIRGARCRSVQSWARHIDEALELFAFRSDVLFNTHHWPVWGTERICAFMTAQRDMYKFMHDQTVRLINHGLTPPEIAETLRLPASLEGQWHLRGYYGSLAHNVRAVYQYYLGWFDANPAHMSPLPPVEAGKRYVEFMGGAEEIVRKARRCFEQGDYRWVAEVMNHVVFACPDNAEARELLADAYEQLGYQCESATWRNMYLNGAEELRHGVQKGPSGEFRGVLSLSWRTIFDWLATRIDPERAAGKEATLDIRLRDADAVWQLSLANCTLNARPAPRVPAPLRLALTEVSLKALLAGDVSAEALCGAGEIAEEAGAPGAARACFQEILASVEDAPDFWFNIVTP